MTYSYSLLCLQIYWITAHGDACNDYGWITTSDSLATTYFEKCKYYCNDGTEHDIRDMSWSELRDECYDKVDYAAAIGLCDSTTTLVYPEWYDGINCYDNDEACPRCPCTSDGTSNNNIIESLFDQECITCSCEEFGVTSQLAWNCNKKWHINDPYEWDLYPCPALTCIDGSTTYYSGDYWWSTSNSCTKFCYCDKNGNSVCEDGYDNIFNTDEVILLAKFKESCGYELRDCLTNTNRWITDTDNCGSCPLCDCGENKVDDIWHIELSEDESFLSFDSDIEYRCIECLCRNQSVVYAYCNDYIGYFEGYSTCPASEQQILQCYYDWGDVNSIDLLPTANLSFSNTFEINSYEEYTRNQYCGWTLDIDDDPDWSWSYGNTLFCQPYIGDGQCGYFTLDFQSTYCGQTETVNFTSYQYCCTGDLCNNVDINMDQCSVSDGLQSFYDTFYGCLYGDDVPSILCENDAEYQVTCQSIYDYTEYYYGCLCSAYSLMYIASDNSNKDWLDIAIGSWVSGLDPWSDHFECGYTFTCNLANGQFTITGGSSPHTSPVSSPVSPPVSSPSLSPINTMGTTMSGTSNTNDVNNSNTGNIVVTIYNFCCIMCILVLAQ